MRRTLSDAVAETLFPPFCVSCDAGGDWWCEGCRTSTEQLATDPCSSCLALSHIEPCSAASALDGLSAAGMYHDPRLRSVITSLKYRGGTCLLPSIATYLRSWRETRRRPWPWAGASSASLVPIPTSPNRVRERGFNQAELLAEAVRTEIVPWAERSDLLIRDRESSPQAELEVGPLRRANAQGVFAVRSDASIPATVILIDDVSTSGATLHEAASLLKTNGVQHVYAVVLAIGT